MNTCRQSGGRGLCVTGDLFYDDVSSSDHCTRQVPGSNTDISWDIGLFEDLHSFTQSIHAEEFQESSSGKPLPIPSKPLPNHPTI